MADLVTDLLAPTAPPPSVRLHAAALRMAGRLADLLDDLEGPAPPGLRALATPEATADGTCVGDPAVPREPVDRLAAAAVLVPVELDLLVLAGCGHEHEVVAAALRRLHPLGQPAATAGLAAQLADHGLLACIGPTGDSRPALAHVLEDGTARRAGILGLRAGPSFWDRDLVVDFDLWASLHGRPRAATAIPPILAGLEEWLAEPDTRAAAAAIAQAEPVTVELRADRPLAAAARAVALAAWCEIEADVVAPVNADARPAIAARAAHGHLAVLVADEPPDLDGVPFPVVVCLPAGAPYMPARRPTLAIRMTPLDRRARRRLWDTVAPGRACPSGLEPIDVAMQRSDLGGSSPCPGATLIHPTATWDDLVLPVDATAQLREAAARGAHEATVLHRWRFLEGRPGAAGLRLLFCGPPGTGKTLAAEVLARELERDLLVVDLSQLVSKWIGETEKNLAAAFDAAERGDCVLFFDEADALFGRRTEVGDARDRYANLETAYLLGRLERFDGVAVLATNLRQNIDVAFGRRLEFIVPFDPPGPYERRLLWDRHLPATAPLDDDVDLDELAALYAIVGAHIRNAAVAAAYLAASAPEGPVAIGITHVLHALRREYDKGGLAFPGLAPDRFERKEPGWRR